MTLTDSSDDHTQRPVIWIYIRFLCVLSRIHADILGHIDMYLVFSTMSSPR